MHSSCLIVKKCSALTVYQPKSKTFRSSSFLAHEYLKKLPKHSIYLHYKNSAVRGRQCRRPPAFPSPRMTPSCSAVTASGTSCHSDHGTRPDGTAPHAPMSNFFMPARHPSGNGLTSFSFSSCFQTSLPSPPHPLRQNKKRPPLPALSLPAARPANDSSAEIQLQPCRCFSLVPMVHPPRKTPGYCRSKTDFGSCRGSR